MPFDKMPPRLRRQEKRELPPQAFPEGTGLPESYDVHWSDKRKEQVVRAVRDKLITFDQARWKYLLSHSEFSEWEKQFAPKPEQPVEADTRSIRERVAEYH